MTEPPKALVICINRRFGADKPSCAVRGSVPIAEAIERGVKERRIAIAVERIVCLGHCTEGPSLRLAPGGRFFLGVSMNQVSEILDLLEETCGRLPEKGIEPPLHLLGS